MIFRAFLALLLVVGLTVPAAADFKRGVLALGMLDYAMALREFREAVEQGDAKALFEIGLMYETCLSGCHPYPLHLGCSQSPE